MIDYLEIARKARKQEPPSAPVAHVWLADPDAYKLLAAGWEPKERCGKIIWEHPDNGFYYSQEIAVHFLDKSIGNVGCKSGANGKG